jgi:hypothetical protein
MFVKVLVLIILFFYAESTGIAAHPIHVSICNIEFNKKESIIAVKLFSDDFGTVLKNNYHEEIVLSKADEEPYRNYIANYVNSNLNIIFKGNKILKFVYDYSEIDEINIWLYFKFDGYNSLKNIKIINTLMLDLYEDQTNLLIINHNGKQDGFRFNNKVRELDIDLK